MKKIILILCTFVQLILNGQQQPKTASNELDISFYVTHIGRNFSLEYNRNINKHSFIIGIKCSTNDYAKPSEYAFKNRFRPKKFTDYIGFSLGYEYHLKEINPYVKPYLLFNIQYAYMRTKRNNNSNYSNYYYTPTFTYSGHYFIFEPTIGAGLSIKLADRIALNQSGGIGGCFMRSNFEEYNYLNSLNFELMYQWRVGVSILLN